MRPSLVEPVAPDGPSAEQSVMASLAQLTEPRRAIGALVELAQLTAPAAAQSVIGGSRSVLAEPTQRASPGEKGGGEEQGGDIYTQS